MIAQLGQNVVAGVRAAAHYGPPLLALLGAVIGVADAMQPPTHSGCSYCHNNEGQNCGEGRDDDANAREQ